MSRRPIHRARVESVIQLTPHYRRIHFGSESFAHIHSKVEGGYMKLLLPKDGSTTVPSDLENLELTNYDKRSFTIRAIGGTRLTLDFGVHDAMGPAMAWASQVVVGQQVLLSGPGPVKMLDHTADAFVLAGDMTGLPGIAVNLAKLPKDAQGICVIEVASEDDKQELEAPEGIDVRWIVAPSETSSNLVAAACELPFPEGTVSVWAACEYSGMKSLREYFTSKGVASERSYVSSYWKVGANDEEHKRVKSQEEKPA